MKKLDPYGQGRHDVINETIDLCEKEIQKIKDHGRYDNDTHANATMSGQIRAYSLIIGKMKSKIKRLKNE